MTQPKAAPSGFARDLPDPEYLRQRLRYDAETGKLFWRAYPAMPTHWLSRYAGMEAFTARRNGYLSGKIDRTTYTAHRIAWSVYYGEHPAGMIDHIDHDKANNRIENLRIATLHENNRNRSLPRNNTSGTIGVFWHKLAGKWTSFIRDGGRVLYIGSFDSIDDAIAARKDAERKLGYHANHGLARIPTIATAEITE